MLEGIPGTAHTLPLLIFHVILHTKVHIHLTEWELFVHVEMALQPGSLCKPSLFFKFKSTAHGSWKQHITQPLRPARGLPVQRSLPSRSLPMQVGCWFRKRCACRPEDAFRLVRQLLLQAIWEVAKGTVSDRLCRSLIQLPTKAIRRPLVGDYCRYGLMWTSSLEPLWSVERTSSSRVWGAAEPSTLTEVRLLQLPVSRSSQQRGWACVPNRHMRTHTQNMYAYIREKPHKSAETETTEPTQHKQHQRPDLFSLSQRPDPSVSMIISVPGFQASSPTLRQVYLDVHWCLHPLALTSTHYACTPFSPLADTTGMRTPTCDLLAPPSIHTHVHGAPLPRKVVRNGVKWENRTHGGDQTRLVHVAGQAYWSATCLPHDLHLLFPYSFYFPPLVAPQITLIPPFLYLLSFP